VSGTAPRLLVATGNPGKLREYRNLLQGAGVELAALDTRVPEDADSYVTNAALKAEAASAAGGLPALGDDSGLEVEALGGYPGLRSARIASTQDERHRLVFEGLAGVPRPWRARFVCAVALAVPGRPTRVFLGERRGELVEPRPGGSGFGYDPVFLVPEAGRTFDEMAPDEKGRWSHRGAAVRALLESGVLASLPS
jgi:XTP/dITP diphosphohydrolase